MNSNWKIKKEGEKGESNIYYLMKDILSCFPDKFEDNFLSKINNHQIVKEATRQILIDEVKKKKQEFRILSGTLILQNLLLQRARRSSIYEVIEVIEPIKLCFHSTFKTIKKLSAEAILKLFTTLYFEYIIMPGRKDEGKEYLGKFRNVYSSNDIIEAMSIEGVYPRWIFERHGISIRTGKDTDVDFQNIIDKFYEK